MLEETDRLPHDLCVHLVSKIGDAGNSRILHERVAEELGNRFADKDKENCNGEQCSNTMNLVGKEGVQINRLVGDRILDQQESVIRCAGIEHPVKDGRNEQGDDSFGKANDRKASNTNR